MNPLVQDDDDVKLKCGPQIQKHPSLTKKKNIQMRLIHCTFYTLNINIMAQAYADCLNALRELFE